MKSKINKRIADIRKARKSKVLKRIVGALISTISLFMVVGINTLPNDCLNGLSAFHQIYIGISLLAGIAGAVVLGTLLLSDEI